MRFVLGFVLSVFTVLPMKVCAQQVHVAPVKVIADLQDAEERALCVSSTEASPDYAKLQRQIELCKGAASACVRTEIPPNPEPFYLPIYLGPKVIPGLESVVLTQRLQSLLANDSAVTSTHDAGRRVDLYVSLSEIRLLSQKEISGLGTIANPLGVLLLPFTSQETARTAYARYDVEMVDPRQGRILRAFRALGVQRGEYTSESLLGGFQLEPEGFARSILVDAALSALRQVAERVKRELSGGRI